MRKFLLPVLVASSLSVAVLAQQTDYTGGSQDPRAVKTYRTDIGIISVNMEAPGVSPQASSIIVKGNSSCEIIVRTQSNSDMLLEGYRLTVSVDGRAVGSVKQDGMRPHESAIHRIRYVAGLPTGNHTVTAKIDPVPVGSMPGEDNPQNNQASLSFEVEGGVAAGGSKAGGADLVVDHISPSVLEAVDKVVIEIGIGNKGGADVSGPVELEVVVAGQSRRVYTTTGVPAGKTAFANVELPSGVYKRSPHGKVTIDPGNRVPESDKSNNSKTF